MAGLKSFPGLTANERTVSPSVQVGMTFYPHENDPIFPRRSTKPIAINWDRKRTQAALQSLHWGKVNGQASGTWEATVKDNAPYQLDIAEGDILPGDWADIVIVRNGVEIPICRGPVSAVNLDRSGAGGATVRTWHLSGKDHGAAWETPLNYSNMWVQSLQVIVEGMMTRRVRMKIGGDPAEMFEILLEAAFGSAASAAIWKLPQSMPVNAHGGQYLFSALDVLAGVTRGGYYNEPYLWQGTGQNTHQVLQDWCNPLMNEMIYDLSIDPSYQQTGFAGANLAARIRERPFPVTASSGLSYIPPTPVMALPRGASEIETASIAIGSDGLWFRLPRWDLPMWCCPNISVGRNGSERFNLFELLADIGFGGERYEQIAQAKPSWYRESIERFGLNTLLETSKFVAGKTTNDMLAGWVRERENWQRLLVQWYALNPWFLSGQITARLAIPDVRVGHRLRLMPTSGNVKNSTTFYVEGVDLNIARSGTGPVISKTTLSVTRGWPGEELDILTAIEKVAGQYKEQF